ncbi:hypothetical protein FBU59_000920, partial [Linderina macrospora]
MKLENHAYSGPISNNDPSLVIIGNKTIPSFHDQVNTWLSDSTHLDPYNLQNDVIGIEIGRNDVSASIPKIMNGTMTLDQLATALGSNIATDVGSLVRAGYKNIYVWNLPAIDNLPYITFLNLEALAKPLVDKPNNKIESDLQPVISQGVHLLDLEKLMNQALDPRVLAAMGITDSTHACDNMLANNTVVICNNPDNYFFYNKIHPASRVHYLWGIVTSIYMRDPSHKFTVKEILQLIKTFDIGNSNVNNNLIVDGITGPESSAIPSGSATPTATGYSIATGAPTNTAYPTVVPTSPAPAKCVK